MILLGKEQPTTFEMQEIFNPTTANMVLQAQQQYIQGLRDDYVRTQEQMQQFREKYGGFYSPYDKDNESWYNITQKPIQEVLQKLGPNAIRSQEGRAMIRQAIYNIDYAALAKLKQAAEIGKEYQKKEAELRSKGLYSEDYQNWINQQKGLPGFYDWDTLKYGVPQQSSPDVYNSLNTATEDWFDDAEPLYKGMEGGNRVYSLDMQDLEDIANSRIQGFVKTPRGAYELYQIRQGLKTINPNMSEEELDAAAMSTLNKSIAQANRERLRAKKFEADDFALASYRASLDNSSSGRGGDDLSGYNIFRDADRNGFSSIAYNPKKSNILRISPLNARGIRTSYDSSGDVTYYTMSGDRVMQTVYSAGTVDTRKYTPTNIKGLDPNANYIFVPDGQIKSREFVDKKNKRSGNRYFVQGRIAQQVPLKDAKGNVAINQDGSTAMTTRFVKNRNGSIAETYMEVKENPHAYRDKNVID